MRLLDRVLALTVSGGSNREELLHYEHTP